MANFITFYLSRLLGKKVRDANGNHIGVIKDLFFPFDHSSQSSEHPLITGIKIKKGQHEAIYDYREFHIEKRDIKMKITGNKLVELPVENINNGLLLAEAILDKQIVDLNGRKLVRVNDIRLAILQSGTHIIAVDIGVAGLLRRMGIVRTIRKILSLFGGSIPAKFILWEDVEAVDFSNYNIKLSKTYAKLQTLHPSDLADIIEDLDKKSRTEVFSALDEEKAADVLEELETEVQVHLIDTLPVAKMADVLEKMPADEVADIIDELDKEKAEMLLSEMEEGSSREVLDLLEYPNNTVGSIMSTDLLKFKMDNTVESVIAELRNKNPEDEELYNLFVTDEKDKLIATFSMRDLLLSTPETSVSEIMKPAPYHLHDHEKIADVAEIIAKYNLLTIPVVDKNNVLQGIIEISNVVEDLINERRTNK